MIGDTAVTICNGALILLGEDTVPDASFPLAASSKRARLLNARYDPVRRAMLRRIKPKFALVQVQITASTTAPPFGWGSLFPLPADFLRLDDLEQEKFDALGWKLIGTNVLTDDSGPINFQYINDCQNPAQFDSLFVSCHELALAAEMAVPLTQSVNKRESLVADLEKLLPDARLAASQEDSPETLDDDVWLRARNY